MRTVRVTKTSVRQRRLACLSLLAITLPTGLMWRLAPLHLPQFAFKYGGSALWAIAVYWAVAFSLPSLRPGKLVVVAALSALAVESFKLVHATGLDSFRDTLAGKLLLGRYFTLGAIAAYWIAIAGVAIFDQYAKPGRGRYTKAHALSHL